LYILINTQGFEKTNNTLIPIVHVALAKQSTQSVFQKIKQLIRTVIRLIITSNSLALQCNNINQQGYEP
jgi:hypothetical protein